MLENSASGICYTASIEVHRVEGSKNVQGVPKKMSFSGKTAITSFKLIQNAKVGSVLENSGYLLHRMDTEIFKIEK